MRCGRPKRQGDPASIGYWMRPDGFGRPTTLVCGRSTEGRWFRRDRGEWSRCRRRSDVGHVRSPTPRRFLRTLRVVGSPGLSPAQHPYKHPDGSPRLRNSWVLYLDVLGTKERARNLTDEMLRDRFLPGSLVPPLHPPPQQPRDPEGLVLLRQPGGWGAGRRWTRPTCGRPSATYWLVPGPTWSAWPWRREWRCGRCCVRSRIR